MKTSVLAAVLLLAVAAAPGRGDDLAALFPKPQEIGGWAVSFDVETYPGEKIYDFINGAGEIFMQFNFEVAASAEYVGPDDAAIAVEIYRMKTPKDAYGVYAYHKPAKADALSIAQEAFTAGITGGLWKDVYYVKVLGLEDKEGLSDAVKEFLAAVAGKIEREGNLPDVFRVLDVEGLATGSIRFLRTALVLKNLHFVSEENVLDLNEGTVMAFADYSVKGRDFKAFVVLYPSEESAVAAAAKYAVFLGAHPEAEAAWFKQKGRVIVGAWTGLKVLETLDSQDVIYETIASILAKVRIYALEK